MALAPLLVPEFDGLLAGLLVLAGAFVALGLVAVLDGFTRATVGGIAGLLAKVPGVGGVLASPVNKVVHWMDHEFGQAEVALDGVIAHYLRDLGRLVSWWGHEMGELGRLLYTVTHALDGSNELAALARLIHYVGTRVGVVERDATAAIHRIEGLEAGTEARIERWVAPRLHALEHAVDDVIPYDIAGLRGLTDKALARVERAWQLIRNVDATTATAAVTAATAVAIGELGLSWIRCNNWRRIGQGICGIPSALIDALLLGVLDALVVADLCDFAYGLTLAAEEVQPALLAFVDAEDALLGCHGATAAPPLSLPPLMLPPVVNAIALAG